MAAPILEILLKAIDEVSKPLDKVSKKLEAAGKSFTDVGKKFAIAGGAMTAAMGLMIKSSVDYAVGLDKMSKASGVATDVLGKFIYAAEQEHASTEAMSKGLTFLQRSLYDASKGIGEGKIAFDELGFSITGVEGNLKPVDEAFLELVDMFGEVTDESKLTGMAMKVFGRAGVELVPFMKLGREEIEKLGDEAVKLGKIMSVENVRAFKAFDDAVVAVRGGVKGLFLQFTTALMPSLRVVAELAKDFVMSAIAWSKANEEIFNTLSKVAIATALGLTAIGGLLLSLGVFLKLSGFLVASLGLLAKGMVFFALKLALPIAALATLVLMSFAIVKSFDTIKTSLSNLLKSFVSFGEAVTKIFEAVFYALTFRPKKAFETMSQGMSMAKVAMLDGLIAIGEGAGETFGNFRDLTFGTFESVANKFSEMKDSLSDKLGELSEIDTPEAIEKMTSDWNDFWDEFQIGFTNSFMTVEDFGKTAFASLSSSMAQTFADFGKGVKDFSGIWQGFLDSMGLTFAKSVSEMTLLWIAGDKQKAASTLAWKALTLAYQGAVAAGHAVVSAFATMPFFLAIPAAAGIAASVKGIIESFEFGGIVPGPEGQPRLIVAHGGEEFRTPAQQRMREGIPREIIIENIQIQFPEVTTFRDWIEADPALIKEVTEMKILDALKTLGEEGKVEEIVKI
jgi:hypothetical protein